ncbi:hypothetical protein OROGR_025210 [Orobanche gracilis]
MESKFIHLLSCILLIFPLHHFPVSARKYSPNRHDTKNPPPSPPPPLDFLKNIIGIRKGSSAPGISQLKKYLSKLGYIDSHDSTKSAAQKDDDFFDDSLELAIINYQSYFKLGVKGILDAETVHQMMRPRCGVPDSGNFRSDHFKNKSRNIASYYTYFPGSPKWPPTKRNLTYSFPPGERTDLNTSILYVLDMWAGVSPFRFTYISDYGQADIKISFQYRDHDDGNPFDGSGGFLAHAFEPVDGRVHYDGDEIWVDGVVEGAFDLKTVGLHELGHVLGLGHTTNDGSIMCPYMDNGLRKGLDQEDIKGIKSLYL